MSARCPICGRCWWTSRPEFRWSSRVRWRDGRHIQKQETAMRIFIPALAAFGLMTTLAVAQTPNTNSDPQPSCTMCEGTYVPAEEIQAYTKKAVAEHRIDQQVRDIDIGKAHIALGVEHRGKLDRPGAQSVAEHDLVSEAYHILDGSATLKLGPNLVNKKRRPADEETVRLYNGPGNNADDIKDGVS